MTFFKRPAACCTALLLLFFLTAALPAAAQTALDQKARQNTFDLVWLRVKERHYDPKLGGVNWDAVRKRYAPRIARAQSDGAFYGLLSQMLGELKQSHFAIIPPAGFLADEAAPSDKGQEPVGGEGTVGMTVELVEDKLVITRVEENGLAAQAGFRPGFVVTDVAGRPLDALLARAKQSKLRPAVMRVQLRYGIAALLSGPDGSSVTVGYIDADDKPQTAKVTRRKPAGEPVRFGSLPPLHTEIETKRLDGNIGYIRFNLFLLPLLDPIKQAVREMRQGGVKGIVLDLRGNGGGVGAMAAGLAGSFYSKRSTLGAMKMRQGEMRFAVFPAADAYTGPLVLLIDEASLSTSEILAGALQENRRAVVVGRASAGMVLPSVIELLPGGARLQYAIADFKTPKGVLLEGRGVLPRLPVPLRRRDLLAGRDPDLDAAVAYITKTAAGAGAKPPAATTTPTKPQQQGATK